MASHDLLVLWTELASLLICARLLGAAARKIGQPSVAGELVAGLILGPSVFGHIWPTGSHWLFPGSGGGTPLQAVVAICLAGLLVSIGAETDLQLLGRLGGAATSVSALSFAVPLAAGIGLALAVAHSRAGLLGPHGGTAAFVVLVAGAVAVTSLPVVAKIISDLGLVRRNVGQLMIAAGTVQDAAGFVLVAIATGLAAASGDPLARVGLALLGVALVTAVVLTVGQRAVDVGLRQVRRDGPNLAGSLTICFAAALIAAAVMQAFGVEGALGAFVAGVALGRSRFQLGRAVSVIDTLTATVFAPIYFATAGLRVDLTALSKGPVLLAFVALVATSLVAKAVGATAGGLAARLPRREVLALCAGLNGRGALQVVIATAGLGVGALTTVSYTIIIVMSLVLSLAVPALLRLALGDWGGTAEEQERLVREEQLERNLVVRGARLLLASLGRPGSVVAAEVLSAVWPADTPATVLALSEPGASTAPVIQRIVDLLGDRPLECRNTGPDWSVEEVLAEANLGYGVLALSASEEPAGSHLLSPLLDELLMRSPLPMLITRRGRRMGRVSECRTVLAAVSGSPSSRAGQEIAVNLSSSLGSRLVLAHAVTRTDSDATEPVMAARSGGPTPPRRRSVGGAAGAAQVVLKSAWEAAIEAGVDAEVLTGQGASAGEAVVAAAEQVRADLIALGTSVRHVDGRPFLGHTVEQVLACSEATVVILALPDRPSLLTTAMAEADPE